MLNKLLLFCVALMSTILAPLNCCAEYISYTDTYVTWHDAIYGNAQTEPWSVRLVQSRDRAGIYMFKPYSTYHSSDRTAYNPPFSYSGWIVVDINNPQKVMLEKYARDNDNAAPWFVQNTPECGYSGSIYGKISGKNIIFPAGTIGVTGRDNMWNTFPHVIEFPDGVPGYGPNYNNSGVFLGLTTFNKILGYKDIERIDEYSVNNFLTFVDNAKKDVYTLLYYAVDESIDMMTRYTYPDDLSSAVLVTFTDGYDRGSIDKKPEYLYASDYANDIQTKIQNTYINGQPLQAYSIGLQGSIDVDDDERFIASLQPLASCSENAMTVKDIKSLEEELSTIANDLVKTSIESQFSVSISGIDHNSRIRLTLDGASTNPDLSNYYVEGVYDRLNNQLTEVEYHGFTSASGEIVQGVKEDIATTFTFIDCHNIDESLFEVDPTKFDHWTAISPTTWQDNDEIERDKDLKVEEIHKSIGVMFAIDCSDSIGDKFDDLKSACKTFINMLATAASGNASIPMVHVEPANGPTKFYDISGREVKSPTRGMYIKKYGNQSQKIFMK